MITGPSALNISRFGGSEARPGEIFVRTAFVGICGTDVHLHAGQSFYLEHGFLKPDCPSDAFATAASSAGSWVGWWQGAASPRAPAWPWLAAALVKAPESLAESQMRELDNQVLNIPSFSTMNIPERSRQ